MPSRKNRHGLTDQIPLPIKRQVRQACGFGCVRCGCAIYEYEHIAPTFAEAKEHDPEKIACLCHGCHGKVTTKFGSKESVARARERPWARQPGNESWDHLDLSTDTLNVELSGMTFVNTPQILVVDGVPLLEIHPPEEQGAPPTLSARFFDRTGAPIARIDRNEWRGSAEPFDIEASGGRWTIRSDSRKIDLVLKLTPPTGVVVERCHLRYEEVEFQLLDGVVSVTRGGTELRYPTDMIRRIERAEFGIAVEGECVSFGSDRPVLVVPGFPGPYKVAVEGGPIEFIDIPEEERLQLPPGFSRAPGSRPVRFSGDGTLSITFPNPFREGRAMSEQERPTEPQADEGAEGTAASGGAEQSKPDPAALFAALGQLMQRQEPTPSKAPFANEVDFGIVDGNVMLDFYFKTPKDRSWVGRTLLSLPLAVKVARGILEKTAALQAQHPPAEAGGRGKEPTQPAGSG